MKAIIDGFRLPQNWQDNDLVYDGIHHNNIPHVPSVTWNGNMIAPPGSVLYLPGYPGTGANIRDFSGKNNNGTISGSQWKLSPGGLYVLNHDGIDDQEAIDHAASLVISTGDFTVGCWFKPDLAGQGTIRILFGKGLDTNPIWRFRLEEANVLYFLTKSAAGTSELTGTTTVAADTWQFGVATRSGTAMKVYLGKADTIYSDSATKTNRNLSGGTRKLYLGMRETTALAFIQPMNGGIGNAFLINGTSWSAAQITNYYNQTKHLFGVWT